jgi:hypothetical protein
MADVFYDQVFMAAGETIQAGWYIGDPFETPPLPDTTTLVVWEPTPFFADLPAVPSFTYNETQITITVGQFQFWKTITNATTDLNNDLIDASFVYLVSFL